MATTGKPAGGSDRAGGTGASGAGPVDVTASPKAVLAPLKLHGARITGGFWGRRQQVNREVTLGEGARRMDEAGNLDNLRLAAGGDQGVYRGELYLDSDVYKWLEAVAWEQAREDSAELASQQGEVTDLVVNAQAADGYLNSFVQVTTQDRGRYADLPFGHELFCGGHLIQGAVAQFRATGSRALLDVAIRYADHLVATFGPDRLHGTDGHPQIEMALVELYRTTRTRAYLDLAQYFVDARGHGILRSGRFGPAYFQDDVAVRDARSIRGHAVRALFLLAGVVDLYLETGERELLDAAVRQWEDMLTGKTYLTGGVGSRWEGEAFGEAFELPPDRAYAETCAAHASILVSWRLLLATGEARFADLLERTLYNGFAPGLSQDGRRFFYVNALQLRPDADTDSARSPARGRQPWYSTACCPPNVMRTLSSLEQYVATQDASGVQIQQYVPGRLGAHLAGGDVELETETGYPWTGRVDIRVSKAEVAVPWTLSLRIPSWSRRHRVAVNGIAIDQPGEPGAYLRLERPWRVGDAVTVELDVRSRFVTADPRVDAVRGCVALSRGPLVYCFEQMDQPEGACLDQVELQCGELQELAGADLLTEADAVSIGTPARMRQIASSSLGSAHPEGPAWEGARGDVVQLTAIPYALWANRELGTMRVFVPTTTPRGAALPGSNEGDSA